MLIKLKDIPEDLEDILDEDEICCGSFSNEFDKAMLENKFFEVGGTRRSHRIITSKAKNLTVEQLICALTGMTPTQLQIEEERIETENEMNNLVKLAEKHNFTLTKKQHSFKDLLKSHQEFMKLLRDKVEEFSKQTGRHNAFKENDCNFYTIEEKNGKIQINVEDGEDEYNYEFSIAEITNSESDLELKKLYDSLKTLSTQIREEKFNLNQYKQSAENFKRLNDIHGVQGSNIDIVKYEQTIKKFNDTISSLEKQLKEVEENISIRLDSI